MLNRHISKSLILIAILLVFVACKKDETNIDKQTEYFGLIEGLFVEYQVTYMFHDSLLQKHDTINYQFKTLIGDTIVDNVGRIAREFHRFQRKNSSLPWEETDIWTSIIVDGRAELVEENQRKVKLVFKPTLEKVWNINAFNNLGKVEAFYSSIDESKTINNLTFEKTLTVEEEDFTTLIETRRKYEVYAKDVGMISKTFKDLEFKFGSSKPIKGEEYYFNVINYGIE
jgi:hypothetical protein